MYRCWNGPGFNFQSSWITLVTSIGDEHALRPISWGGKSSVLCHQCRHLFRPKFSMCIAITSLKLNLYRFAYLFIIKIRSKPIPQIGWRQSKPKQRYTATQQKHQNVTPITEILVAMLKTIQSVKNIAVSYDINYSAHFGCY